MQRRVGRPQGPFDTRLTPLNGKISPMRIASHVLAFLAAAAISGLTLGATLA
jgi:hypothetical protein